MRIAAVALVSVAALLLVGCTPAAHPTSTPKPSATPVFASEEEALAAAKKAYVTYSTVADQILADGGQSPERIDAVTTGTLRSEEHDGSAKFASNGYHETGTTALSWFELESANLNAPPDTRAAVVAYVCLDVSDVDVLNEEGFSVVEPTRKRRTGYEVAFDLVQGRLLPSSQDPWNSDSVCR